MGSSASNLTCSATMSDSTNAQPSKGGIVLYGLPMSPNTQRVLVVLAEKGLKMNSDKSNLWKSRQYLKGLQPFGLFPVLIDQDGFSIYESRAICRYLEEKYKSKGIELIPTTDTTARFLFEQAVNIEAFNFEPSASGIVKEKMFKKMFGRGEPDDVKIAQFREELIVKLDVYERILSKQPYLAEQTYTLPDLFYLPYGALLIKVGEGGLIESRPSWKTVQEMT